MTSSTIDRARGALLGFACGDALGTTVEFHSRAAAQRRKDDAWPRDLVGGGPFRSLPGQVTDDTELMLALARSIVRCGRYDEDEAARAYLRWFESGPFDCGMATRAAFAGYIDDAVPAAAVVAARASEDTQANGSLMRVLPIGVLGVALARERVAQWAMADSRHSSLLKNASCLRARSLTRSLRRSNYVESGDSTTSSLLDLEPDPEPSATEPLFKRLLQPSLLGHAVGVCDVCGHGRRRDRAWVAW